MSKHMPPVPPENQSNKGPGEHRTVPTNIGSKADDMDRNLAQQGRQGDVKQNTTNQGHQQGR